MIFKLSLLSVAHAIRVTPTGDIAVDVPLKGSSMSADQIEGANPLDKKAEPINPIDADVEDEADLEVPDDEAEFDEEDEEEDLDINNLGDEESTDEESSDELNQENLQEENADPEEVNPHVKQLARTMAEVLQKNPATTKYEVTTDDCIGCATKVLARGQKPVAPSDTTPADTQAVNTEAQSTDAVPPVRTAVSGGAWMDKWVRENLKKKLGKLIQMVDNKESVHLDKATE